jgi:hypothetical protein
MTHKTANKSSGKKKKEDSTAAQLTAINLFSSGLID